jgi:cytochrome c oxidase subunit 2
VNVASEIEKIELYLDGEQVPCRLASAPPCRVELDTSSLSDGEHALRVVAVLSEGQRVERTLRFNADSFPCAIEGLADGGTVRGNLELEVKPKPPFLSHVTRTRSYESLYVLVAAAMLLGLWLYLVLSTGGKSAVAAVIEPAASPQPGAAGPPPSEPPPSGTAMAGDRSVYVQHCASCHQSTGAGVPGAFPPLADNDHLADASFVIRTVLRGKSGPIVVRGQPYNGQMPALGAQLSDSEVASVVTYVRSSFGNHFGNVSESQVKALR